MVKFHGNNKQNRLIIIPCGGHYNQPVLQCVATLKGMYIKKGASENPMHRKMHDSLVTTTNYLQEAFSLQEIEHAFLPKSKITDLILLYLICCGSLFIT